MQELKVEMTIIYYKRREAVNDGYMQSYCRSGRSVKGPGGIFRGLFQKNSPPAGGPLSQIGLAGAESAQNIINAYPGKGDNRALFSGKPRPV